ncbi:hypothetical protein EV363DRAFT_1371164 [Boletus edulis]|uniref:Secreted protein n=1 Tax=Boletus edulis BED1 TaxID=1328754 RepID=A0AAD4G7H2_BOLED|nr:hypothetical protein EV363DRAFT_1371164 [Boletus edulis]KAF8420756.1 hypothetical protein L210DRAFT_3574205 [Boletus edulis BED1]
MLSQSRWCTSSRLPIYLLWLVSGDIACQLRHARRVLFEFPEWVNSSGSSRICGVPSATTSSTLEWVLGLVW